MHFDGESCTEKITINNRKWTELVYILAIYLKLIEYSYVVFILQTPSIYIYIFFVRYILWIELNFIMKKRSER